MTTTTITASNTKPTVNSAATFTVTLKRRAPPDYQSRSGSGTSCLNGELHDVTEHTTPV